MDDKKGAIEHLEKHQMYPATRNDLVKECYDLSDFSSKDKKWFMENLPEGTYDSPKAVMQAIGW